MNLDIKQNVVFNYHAFASFFYVYVQFPNALFMDITSVHGETANDKNNFVV